MNAAPKTTAPALSPLEEQAIAAKQEHILHESQVTAEKLEKLFDESATTFRRAKTIAAGIDKGADVNLIASLLSEARAAHAYPDASESDLNFYATTAPSKGGVMVPKSSVSAYDGAWRSVQRAGLTPTEVTVNIAFKVLSKGRTAQPRKALEAKIAAAVEAEEVTAAEAEAAYVTGSREILTGRLATEAKPRPEGNRKASDSEDGEPVTELTEGVPMSLEVAIHNIAVIIGQPWSESERAELFAYLATAIENAETVEV